MLASTCLAVLFVPSFFVVLQRWQERRRPLATGPTLSGGGAALAAGRLEQRAEQ
jgi:HAE1 family hydrophobic/amphiphilic exporter-1